MYLYNKSGQSHSAGAVTNTSKAITKSYKKHSKSGAGLKRISKAKQSIAKKKKRSTTTKSKRRRLTQQNINYLKSLGVQLKK